MNIEAGSRFNLYPTVRIQGYETDCVVGWEAIGQRLRRRIEQLASARVVVALECYPGIDECAIERSLGNVLQPDAWLATRSAFKSPAGVERLVRPFLTEDPVFGRLSTLVLEDFLDSAAKASFREQLTELDRGVIVVCGVAASLLADPQILVYADLSRWEAQLRFRRNESTNLGVDNRQASWQQQYKRGYFVDWRAADKLKQSLMDQWDFVLDTHDPERPKLASGEAIREGLRQTARRPFSLVPYFDPAPWGGHWMQQNFGLDPAQPNFGWGFTCVPEENSLLLEFGHQSFELPAIDLVFFQPLELLGPAVYDRFGAEFPIRFDFLDTMGGGNLSLQVHPTADYIQQHFGMPYTQDESYYFLQAKPGASVFLGLKEQVDAATMLQDLAAAEAGICPFDATRYVNRFPARKHDHVLIPAGTVHCQAAESVVLEISATPYLFTFKLWDWNRTGLDGRPRPIHLQHGQQVIDWSRTSSWVRKHLINCTSTVAIGDHWREERTGLHPDEPLETRRHWFTDVVPHETGDTVNVLCLVEGEKAIVESPKNEFDPFVVRYAETFVIPAAVGAYTIRPVKSGDTCATMKAFVRPESGA